MKNVKIEESEDPKIYELPDEKPYFNDPNHFLRSVGNELKRGRKKGHIKKWFQIQPEGHEEDILKLIEKTNERR